MKLIIFLLAAVVLASGCVQQSVDWQSCAYDSDCVKVSGGCCGCNEGGSAIAINKNFVDQWNTELSDSCAETACIQSISDDPSCAAAPRCVNYKCGLVGND